jgi:hypothetical protein
MADSKRAAAAARKRDIAAATWLLKRWGCYLDVEKRFEKRDKTAREFLEDLSERRRKAGRPPQEIDALTTLVYWLVQVARERGASMREARAQVSEFFKKGYSVHQIERWHAKVTTLPLDARGYLSPSWSNHFNAFLDKREPHRRWRDNDAK